MGRTGRRRGVSFLRQLRAKEALFNLKRVAGGDLTGLKPHTDSIHTAIFAAFFHAPIRFMDKSGRPVTEHLPYVPSECPFPSTPRQRANSTSIGGMGRDHYLTRIQPRVTCDG